MIPIFKPPSQARSETKQENSIAAAQQRNSRNKQQQQQQWSSTNPQKRKWKWNPIKPASIRREKTATNCTLVLVLNCSFSSSLLHRKERGRNATGDGHGDARRHSQTSLLDTEVAYRETTMYIQRDYAGETTMHIRRECTCRGTLRCTYRDMTMYIQRAYKVYILEELLCTYREDDNVHTEKTTMYIQ